MRTQNRMSDRTAVALGLVCVFLSIVIFAGLAFAAVRAENLRTAQQFAAACEKHGLEAVWTGREWACL